MFGFSIAVLLSIVFLSIATRVVAERHTVKFNNRCGHGTPTLIKSGQILSTGKDYTINGPLLSAIAYLQTGKCGLNGEGCTLVEVTLKNPTSPGSGSSSDISLIPPLAFSVPSSFAYYGSGCKGAGADCNKNTCKNAFRVPTDNQVQVQCPANDVNLAIGFCLELTGLAKKPASSGLGALGLI